jgi:large repetitive protein
MGCSPIQTTPVVACNSCPVLSYIFADACGTEEDNEYMIMLSGSGFVTDQLSVNYDAANNIGAGNADVGSGCGWQTPTPATIASLQTICPGANIIAAGPGVTIPANQIVFVFPSSNFSFAYNWASICPLAPNIYVMQSSCARTTGAFTNKSTPGSCTTVIDLNCGCSSNISYNTNSLTSGANGDWIVKVPIFGLQYGNVGCGLPPVNFPPPATPPAQTFSLNYTVPAALCNTGPFYVAGIPSVNGPGCPPVQTNQLSFNVVCPQAILNTTSICSGAPALNLNTLITNGPIAGNWTGLGTSGSNFNPASLSGPTNVTFTPSSTCGIPTTTVVTVNPSPTATISPIAPVCSGTDATLNISFTGTGPWTFDLIRNGTVYNTYTTSSNPFQIMVPINAASSFTLGGFSVGGCGGGTSNTVNATVTATYNGTLAASGPTSVCGGAGTTLQVIFAGGAAPYTFVYAVNGVNQPAVTTSTNPYILAVSPSSTSTYTLQSVGTGACAGTAVGSVVITAGAAITGALTSGSTALCQGQTVNLTYNFTGTPPFTFVPTINGAAQAPVVANSTSFSQTLTPGLGLTTYGIDMVSAGGCSAAGTGFYDVSVSVPSTATISGNVTSCNPGSSQNLTVNFAGGGPYMFTYSANGVAQPPVMTGSASYTLNVSPSANTTYLLLSVSNSACTGTVSGTASVTIDNNPLTATLTGGGQVCPGGPSDTLIFSFTGNAPYTFTYAANGVAQPPVTTNNNPHRIFQHPAMGTNYALQSVTNGTCNGTVSGAVWVFVFTPPTASISGGGTFCGSGNMPIEIDLTGTAPFNIGYTINGVSQPIINTNDDPYVLTVATSSTQVYQLDTVYSTGCPGTVSSAPITYTVNPILSYSNVMLNCNATAGNYTITATLAGTPPFTLVSGAGTFSGNQFTSSTALLSAANYSFVINDSKNCGPITISGTANCSCTTSAGTMQLAPLTDCTTDVITAVHNSDDVLDADDKLVFILHSNAAYPFGTIYAQANTPAFSFQAASMTIGTTYYISALAANGTPTGVDTSDLCRSVSAGTPVRWLNPPSANMSGTYAVCSGQQQTVAITLTGNPIFNLTYSANGTNIPITTSNTTYNISTALLQSGAYSLIGISDQYCVGTVSGSATVTVSPALVGTTPTVSCNPSNGTYLVNFNLSGTAPYTVITGNGTVTGSAFTSASTPLTNSNYLYAIRDANNCDTIYVTGTANCACTTESGSMNQNLLTVCGNGQATATHLGNDVLDANDALIFYLHERPSYPFGTIYAQNNAPVFGRQAGMLSGVIYYISAVAGDQNAAGVDTTDQCLSVSLGTPVRWIDLPTANLQGNYDICPGENQLLTINLNGQSPYQLSYSVNGTPITVTAINPTTFGINTNLMSDGVYTLISVASAGCTGTATGTARINVHTEPVITGVDVICAPDAQSYTVEFNVNHDSLSSVTITGSIGGNYDTLTGHFVSAPVPIANSWNAFVEDRVWYCGVDSVSGMPPNCSCPNTAGVMPNISLDLCDRSPAAVPAATGAILEPGDTLIYALCTGPNLLSGTLLVSKNIPSFDFNAGLMTSGQTYYILALSGNKLAGGGLDFGDQCLDIASGPTVVWRRPVTAFLSGNSEVCTGDTAELLIVFQGIAPFTYTYLANALVQGPFVSPTDTVRLLLSPPLSVNYSVGTVVDGTMCTGTFSGGGALSVALPPDFVDTQVNCNSATLTYTVSFKISNGANPNPVYQLAGSAGTLVDTFFTSDPIPWGQPYQFTVTDAKGCSNSITATPSCTCQADAGNLTTQPIQECVGQLVFVQSAGDFNIPSSGKLQYAILSDTTNFPASIITTSPTAQFAYQAGIMMPNIRYYIVAMVGDTLPNGNINLTDNCLNRSNAIPLTWRPVPTAMLSGAQTVCPGGSAALQVNMTGTAPFVFSYQVNGGAPISIPANSNTFPVNSSNILQNQQFALLSVSDANCTGVATGTGTIMVTPAPEASLVISDSVLCIGQQSVITLLLKGDSQFDLVIGGGATPINLNGAMNGEGVTISPTQNSVYTITSAVPDTNTCPVKIGPPVRVYLDTVAVNAQISNYNGYNLSCANLEDGFIQVNPTKGIAPYTYAWSNGDTTARIDDLKEDLYNVTVTDAQGCSTQYSGLLIAPPAIVPVWSKTNPSCRDVSDGFVSLESVAGGQPPFELGIINNATQIITPVDSLIVGGLKEEVYTLVLTDATGCSVTEAFILEADDALAFDLGPDQTVGVGDSVALVPNLLYGSIQSFTWTPGRFLLDSTSLNTMCVPYITTVYTLSAVSPKGCKASDDIKITVKLDDRLYIPNIINPNAPGNDLVFVYTTPNIKALKNFRLYDRWGAQMVVVPEVSTDGTIPIWDGTWKGKFVNPGVYTYVVDVEYVNGTSEIVGGDITVVR